MEYLYEENILIKDISYIERVPLWLDEIIWMKH